MGELEKKKCVPCTEGSKPLKGDYLKKFSELLGPSWKVVEEHHLEKEYLFKNFKQALDFTVRVGELAEKEGHHPDIYLSWGKAKVTYWTHKINGLSESDFIMAAKTDLLLS